MSANLGQSCLATRISAPGPSSFGWFRHTRLPSSRALQHQGNPRIPFHSFPRQFHAPNLQNAATTRPNAGELELIIAHFSTAAPPAQTPPSAPPRSRVAPRPLLFHPRPPKHPRRRSPTPTAAVRRRRVPSRPSPTEPGPPKGAARAPHCFPPPSPHRRCRTSPESEPKRRLCSCFPAKDLCVI